MTSFEIPDSFPDSTSAVVADDDDEDIESDVPVGEEVVNPSTSSAVTRVNNFRRETCPGRYPSLLSCLSPLLASMDETTRLSSALDVVNNANKDVERGICAGNEINTDNRQALAILTEVLNETVVIEFSKFCKEAEA